MMESKTVTYESEQEYTYRRGAGNDEKMMHRDYLNIIDGTGTNYNSHNSKGVSQRSKVNKEKRTRNRDFNDSKKAFKKENSRNFKESSSSLEIDGRKLI